VIFRTCGIFNI